MMLRFGVDYLTRTRARLRRQRWMKRVERRVKENIKRTIRYAERSTQAFVVAYWYFVRRRRPIVLSQLYAFARARGVKISYASLKYSLHYMREKGLLVRRGRGVYDLAGDLKEWSFSSIIGLLDMKRAKAGKASSPIVRSKSNKSKGLRKHAVRVADLMKKYNTTNIARHIEKHLKNGRRVEALAELIILCSGVRPSDVIEDISVVNGEVWLVIYERKTQRIRYVKFLGSVLMQLLLQRSEMIRMLVNEFLEKLFLAKRGRKILDWLRWLLLIINMRRKTIFDLCRLEDARRIYLTYEEDGKARYLVGEKRREIEKGRILNSSGENIVENITKRAIVGVHLDDDNDDYYILKR
mgnify:CR=1 FL=1